MSERVSHAKIKFVDDKTVKVVPITKIKEFQVRVPVNVNDFKKNSFLYNCIWTDEKNPEEIELPVQICELAVIESEQDLKSFENKRGNFRPLHDTTIDDYYAENTNSDSSEDVRQKKEIEKKHKQKKAAANKMQKQILEEKRKKLQEFDNLVIKNKKPRAELETLENSLQCNSIFVDITNKPAEVKTVKGNDYDSNQFTTNSNEKYEKLLEKYEKLSEKCNKLENENIYLLKKYSEINEKIEMYKCLNEKLQFDLFLAQKKLLQKEKQSLPEKSEKRKFVSETCTTAIAEDQKKINLDIELDSIVCSTPIKKTEKNTFEKTETNIPVAGTALEELNEDNNFDDFPNHLQNAEYSTPTKHFGNDSPHSSTDKVKETCRSDPSNSDDEVKNCIQKNKKRLFQDEDNFTEYAAALKKQKNESKQKNNLHHDSASKAKEKDVAENEVNEEIFSNFGEKVKEKHDGEIKLMIHLNKDFKIPYHSWKQFLKLSSSLFLKKIFREMYAYPEEVCRRCVIESEKSRTPQGRNKRKQISPVKAKTLDKCLRYYHMKNDEAKGKKLETLVAKKNHYLTEDINKAIQQMKKLKE